MTLNGLRMDWVEQITEAFDEHDVHYVAYLPDSRIWPLVERLESDDRFDVQAVAREEEAVGMLAGAWLGGQRGALVCQTSGLANTLNALAGVSKPWGLPFVGVVSRRGGIGEHNLAQVPGGYAMPGILDEIGVRNHSLDGTEDVRRVTEMSARTAFSTEEPHVLFVERQLTEGAQ